MSHTPFTEMQLAAIDHVIGYVGTTTDDWLVIKVQLVKIFAPFDRSSFSGRHPGSMKFFINDFERDVMEYWELKTGIKPKMDESRLHREEEWPNNPKGWGLVRYNEERRLKKQNKGS